MKNRLKSGDLTKCKKYILVASILSVECLVEIIYDDKLICYKGKMTPTAFVRNWSLHYLLTGLKQGFFWHVGVL